MYTERPSHVTHNLKCTHAYPHVRNLLFLTTHAGTHYTLTFIFILLTVPNETTCVCPLHTTFLVSTPPPTSDWTRMSSPSSRAGKTPPPSHPSLTTCTPSQTPPLRPHRMQTSTQSTSPLPSASVPARTTQCHRHTETPMSAPAPTQRGDETSGAPVADSMTVSNCRLRVPSSVTQALLFQARPPSSESTPCHKPHRAALTASVLG